MSLAFELFLSSVRLGLNPNSPFDLNGVLRQRAENITVRNVTPFHYCYIIKRLLAATSAELTSHNKSQRFILSNDGCRGSGVIFAPVHNKAFLKCRLL